MIKISTKPYPRRRREERKDSMAREITIPIIIILGTVKLITPQNPQILQNQAPERFSCPGAI